MSSLSKAVHHFNAMPAGSLLYCSYSRPLGNFSTRRFRVCLTLNRLARSILDLVCLQVLADDQVEASSAEEDEVGLDDINVNEIYTSASDEEEEEEEDTRVPSAKKQKTGSQGAGLGSVGWEASDEEDNQAVPASQIGKAL